MSKLILHTSTFQLLMKAGYVEDQVFFSGGWDLMTKPIVLLFDQLFSVYICVEFHLLQSNSNYEYFSSTSLVIFLKINIFLFFFTFFINICIIKFYFFEWNHRSTNILFLKTSLFLLNSICRFCWNLNSLYSLVISNNSFKRRSCKVKLSC